jgi:hypothetical protein
MIFFLLPVLAFLFDRSLIDPPKSPPIFLPTPAGKCELWYLRAVEGPASDYAVMVGELAVTKWHSVTSPAATALVIETR